MHITCYIVHGGYHFCWNICTCNIFKCKCYLHTSHMLILFENVLFSDPAFEGMVTTICSNSLPCILQFHSICWQYLKKRYGKTEDKVVNFEEIVFYKNLTIELINDVCVCACV